MAKMVHKGFVVWQLTAGTTGSYGSLSKKPNKWIHRVGDSVSSEPPSCFLGFWGVSLALKIIRCETYSMDLFEARTFFEPQK